MSRLSLFRAAWVLVACGALLACGGNPSVNGKPDGVPSNGAGAGVGGKTGTDDPISLGGAIDTPSEGGMPSSPAEPACGNAVLEDDEQCDDGNREPGDGCAEACTREEGFD